MTMVRDITMRKNDTVSLIQKKPYSERLINIFQDFLSECQGLRFLHQENKKF